jgi:ankyrin repeat protein
VLDASSFRHVQVVKVHPDHGADIEGRTMYVSITPLHWACHKGHAAVVNELLSRGANTEAKDIQGDTPLHAVCQIPEIIFPL